MPLIFIANIAGIVIGIHMCGWKFLIPFFLLSFYVKRDSLGHLKSIGFRVGHLVDDRED